MKSIKRIIAVLVACVAIVAPASAQFSFGIKAGAKINQIPETVSGFEWDDCSGFTGGVMGEFMFPIIGLGVDASLMYVYAPLKTDFEVMDKDIAEVNSYNHYLEIPINLKYKLSIPAVEKIVAPYIFTGPSFAFLLSGKSLDGTVMSYFEQNPVDIAWNLGIGIELFNHLQIGASYGWGLSNTYKKVQNYGIIDQNNVYGKYINDLEGVKKNCWTITAAYTF